MKLQSQLRQFVAQAAVWVVATGLYLLFRYFGTGEVAIWEGWAIPYYGVWLTGGLAIAIIFNLTSRLCRIDAIRDRAYWIHIGINVLSVGLALMVIALGLLIAARRRDPTFDPSGEFVRMIIDPQFFLAFIYFMVVSALMSFVQTMGTLIGPRILKNLLLGHYRSPKTEDRVFSFMDMKDSTTHAERLGHQKFSRLIQQCFKDLNQTLESHSAEVYRYVGDEAILTWTMADGVRDGHCVKAFLDFQQSLDDRADEYETEFGLVPKFKAGIHAGPVTVAQIGDLRREISYLSDVLNTTARIEGQCNTQGRSLLVSQTIRDLLADIPDLEFDQIGSIELRGKNERVCLFGVTCSDTESK